MTAPVRQAAAAVIRARANLARGRRPIESDPQPLRQDVAVLLEQLGQTLVELAAFTEAAQASVEKVTVDAGVRSAVTEAAVEFRLRGEALVKAGGSLKSLLVVLGDE